MIQLKLGPLLMHVMIKLGKCSAKTLKSLVLNRVAFGKHAIELRQPARHAGFDSANGHFQNIGNSLVRTTLQVEKRHRRAVHFIHLAQHGIAEQARGSACVSFFSVAETGAEDRGGLAETTSAGPGVKSNSRA
jgi:hypothetical protein